MKCIIPHYVYELENSLTGKVFYVGKGHDIKRMNAHEREARQGIDSYKCRVIRKIWANGGVVIRHKVAEFDNALDALIYEWFRINMVYGLENLTNIVEGGQGPNGYEHTPEHIEANRQRGIERMADPGRRAYISQINKGKKMTPDQLERWRQSMQENDHTEGYQKQSVNRIAWWKTEDGIKLREEYSKHPEYRTGSFFAGHTRNAKTYVGFVSPSGEVFKDIHNLKAFCHEHGLPSAKIHCVNSGKYKQYNGWRKYDPDKPIEAYPVPNYAFLSPEDIVYTDIHNLTQFCREHGLDAANMHRVSKGQQCQYKGWIKYNS